MSNESIEFDNDVTALMVYSNVIPARSLGRRQTGIAQIDGSKGTIIGGDIYVTLVDALWSGAKGVAYRPERTTVDVDGVKVLECLCLELPGQVVTWENLLKNYLLSAGQITTRRCQGSPRNAVCQECSPSNLERKQMQPR